MVKVVLIMLFLAAVLTGCGAEGTSMANGYQQISQEDAKQMMDHQEVIVLDVREQHEYDAGHIPGAVLLPVGSIKKDTAEAVIPSLDSAVLVYCRSGNRSRTAAAALANLGYSQVFEFGGINTWPYEVE